MTQFRVKDLMVPNPAIIGPETTLKEAIDAMQQIDCGIMPVGTQDHLVGMITDRDITLRAIARGKDPSKTTVKDIMTNKVFSVTENADLSQAADIFKAQKVNRLIVKDVKGKTVGILSLSGLIRETADVKALTQFIEHLAEKVHRKKAA